jgi:multidrug resistance protein, MATE family
LIWVNPVWLSPPHHRVPLLFAAISYWLIGFPAAYGLAFWTKFGAVGVWIGLSCGTAVYAILLIVRFRRLAGRLGFAATAHAN